MKKFICLLLLLSQALLATAEEDKSSIRFAGIPSISYTSDSGFGGGAVGSMYIDDEGFYPYKMALNAKAYISTQGMNSHSLALDRLRAFNLPLRLIGRLGFYSTVDQNYCGLASDALCDVERAKTEAFRRGLEGSDEAKFVKDYYHRRYMMFYGELYSRWLLWQDVAKLELMGGYRGHYYLNRSFTQKGIYPGSLYDQHFKDQKTEGYLSTLELGLMLDKRDNEPAPTSGYWLEASVRSANFVFGSAWDYVGSNISARFYVPFDEQHRVVFASQSIVDAIFGDLPYDAMSRLGGSQALSDLNAIGGQYIGRGISEQLYVGRFKVIEQAEIRYNFWSFDLWKQHFDCNVAAFGDAGMTAWDYQRFIKDMQKVYLGFGGGLRLSWNKTFVVRADLGVSPEENFKPKVYIVVGNVF